MNVIYHRGSIFRPSSPSFIVPKSLAIWEGQDLPEASLINWCPQFLSKDKNFVDIGGHMGIYTVNLAPYCKQVYTFEPQKMTYYGLCGNVFLNGLNNVTTHNVAMGETQGTAELKIICDNGGGSSLSNLPTNQAPMATEVVPVHTLDQYNLTDIALIKIDVEGHELAVLRGATQTILREQPRIIFECWPESWYADRARELQIYVRDTLGYKNVRPVTGLPHIWVASPN